jgi:hypothetical protein
MVICLSLSYMSVHLQVNINQTLLLASGSKTHPPAHVLKELATKSEIVTPWWWGLRTLIKVNSQHCCGGCGVTLCGSTVQCMIAVQQLQPAFVEGLWSLLQTAAFGWPIGYAQLPVRKQNSPLQVCGSPATGAVAQLDFTVMHPPLLPGSFFVPYPTAAVPYVI